MDTMVFREEGLRHLVAEVGINQIVYGTDYPFDWPVGVDFVLKAAVPEQCRQGGHPGRQRLQAAADHVMFLAGVLETRGHSRDGLKTVPYTNRM